jgi:DNA-binding MarR family transcriptional regulator
MELPTEKLLTPLWAIPRLKFELLDSFWKEETNRKLNKTQERTMLAIKFFAGENMTALSKIAGVEKGSFTHIVDRLQDEGFITRKRDSKDKRNTILELTAKGRAYLSNLDTLIKKYFEDKFSVLSAEEKESFFTACNTIIEMMEVIISGKDLA